MVYNINFSYHIFQRNKQKYDVCGDSCFIGNNDTCAICVVADGLGSGPNAHDSAQIVTSIVEQHCDMRLDQLMLKCNDALKLKRGAVASIIRCHFDDGEMQYCGIGNISCYLMQNGHIRYPRPHYGYLAGKQIEPFVEVFPIQEGDKCMIHSDGIEMNDVSLLTKEKTWQALICDKADDVLTYKNDDQTYAIMQF